MYTQSVSEIQNNIANSIVIVVVILIMIVSKTKFSSHCFARPSRTPPTRRNNNTRAGRANDVIKKVKCRSAAASFARRLDDDGDIIIYYNTALTTTAPPCRPLIAATIVDPTIDDCRHRQLRFKLSIIVFMSGCSLRRRRF